MRKGILSLSKVGRKRPPVKKTVNMETAEKAAVRKAEPAVEQNPAALEKMFVQTIQVPKQRTVKEAKAQRKPAKARNTKRGR